MGGEIPTGSPECGEGSARVESSRVVRRRLAKSRAQPVAPCNPTRKPGWVQIDGGETPVPKKDRRGGRCVAWSAFDRAV